jgi:hypothetical protein
LGNAAGPQIHKTGAKNARENLMHRANRSACLPMTIKAWRTGSGISGELRQRPPFKPDFGDEPLSGGARAAVQLLGWYCSGTGR